MKVSCLYNKHFFLQLYKYMVDNGHITLIDASDTLWHIKDVEHILITQYGFKLTGVQ